MNIEKVKRYSLLEIVLLVIFVFGLLIANRIARVRSQITLSEPVPLPGAGLSVSMPAGTGWEPKNSWRYQTDNCMIIINRLRGQGNDVEVRWRYNLFTPEGSPKELLTQRAEQTNAVIVRIGVIDRPIPMDYAYMISSSGREGRFFIGIIRLDWGRSLELQVLPHAIDEFYAESIFQTLAGSVQYNVPQELIDGGAVLDAFLLARTKEVSQPTQADEAFLITSESGRNLGYYYTRRLFHADNEKTLQQMRIRQFEFQGIQADSNLSLTPRNKDYRWKTALSYPGMNLPNTYDIASDGNGNLQIQSNIERSKALHSSHFVLPEPLLGEYAQILLPSDFAGVIVDVLAATGQAVPVRVTKIEMEQAHNKPDGSTSVVRLDFLNRSDSFEELYFDPQQRLVGKYEQKTQQQRRFWKVVSFEQLQLIFRENFQSPADPIAGMPVLEELNR